MDLIAWGLTAIAGLGVVTAFIIKFLPKAEKGVSVAADSLETLKDILAAAKPDADGVIRFTKEEIDEIVVHINAIKADIKA